MKDEEITTDQLNSIRMRLYDADTRYQNTLESLRGMFGGDVVEGMNFDEYIHKMLPQLCELRDHVDNLSNQLIKTHENIKANKNVH